MPATRLALRPMMLMADPATLSPTSGHTSNDSRYWPNEEVAILFTQSVVAADTPIEAPIDAGIGYESRLVLLGYSVNPRAAEAER
jgi:hypothetical protein